MDANKVVPDVPLPSRAAESWTFEESTKIDEYLFCLKNVKLFNDDKKEVNKKYGKYYLAEYNPLYWHFLHEDLAGYEGLRKVYPDLKLGLIDSQQVMVDATTVNEGWKHLPYIEYFAKLYAIEEQFLSTENYEFEEVYYTPSSGLLFSEAEFWGDNEMPVSVWRHEGYQEWDASTWDRRSLYALSGMNALTQKLYENISVDYSLPKKIFISRRDVNARLKEHVGKPEYEHLVEERLYEGDFLEEYFAERGYEIIALEEYSYEKQMQFFMTASHVAGTVGAGFSNLHMSQPSTKLIELHVLPTYGFDYGYYKNFRAIDYCPVELRNLQENRTLNQEEMLEVLNGISI